MRAATQLRGRLQLFRADGGNQTDSSVRPANSGICSLTSQSIDFSLLKYRIGGPAHPKKTQIHTVYTFMPRVFEMMRC